NVPAAPLPPVDHVSPTIPTPAVKIAAPPRTTVPGTPGRVLNPFLVQDPQVKARRLARALISDMISYHPAKRAQGLKDGTLKQGFEEEIKKSYEEYVMQVGEALAKSTTHFTDALNEILAGGQKMF
ncbi:MAG: hypothetical protein ACHQU1_06140, partial [Gemmatimonadales bacterium]